MAFPGSGTFPSSTTFPGADAGAAANIAPVSVGSSSASTLVLPASAIRTSSPDLWLRSESLTTLADGAAVSSWVDSSSNGAAATQPASANQPTYKAGIITASGKPVVRFDGSDWLTSAAPTNVSSQTVIAVARPSSLSSAATLRGASTSGGLQLRYETSGKLGLIKQSQVGIGTSGSSSSTTAFEVVVARFKDNRLYDVVSSSDYNAASTAANAVNADTSTIWLSGGSVTASAPEWLRLKPRTPTVATSVKIYSRTGRAGYQAKDFKIQGSNDGASWTDLDTRAGVTWADAETKTFTFSNSTAWTYYRIFCTATQGPASPASFEIAEIALNSDVTPADVATYSFFRNGAADGGGAVSGLLPFVASTTMVGRNEPTGEHMVGDIAVLASWSRALTDAEIADITAELTANYLSAPAVTPTTTGTSPVSVGSTSTSMLVPRTTGTSPVGVGSSSNTILVGIVPVTTGTSPVGIGSSAATSLVIPTVTTTGTSPVDVAASSATDIVIPSTTTTSTSPVVVGSSARTYTPGAVQPGVTVGAGIKVEVGALTLLNLKALPGVDVPIGLDVNAGDSQAVVPLPGVSVDIGLSLIGRQVDVSTPDPRRRASQWRYVMTDLANTPLGELTDLQHDPVEDGVGEPATMQFTIATDSDESSLIKPIERQCQVWDGDRLLLRGPVLPGRPSDDGTTMTYTIHDPSWFWRDGRRVITRTPQKNLLRNGDFKMGLTYWTRGYDKDSIPKAAPNVRVVSEDFVDDTDGLDPIKAAEIFGVESVTESELSSNAVFWPNLATFRPGGKAAIEAVANAMPTTAGLKVTVIGHTANDGTGNGLGLSARRAAAAKAVILTKRPSAVITTKGVGFYDPKPGFPIDSQEQRRVVIQYDQTITGKSKQWMKQTLEVTQPKEARYPLALTAAAMLKVADDWSVPDANMMSVRVVVRRKSSPTKIFDEGSASIGDTDPVDRWIDQTAEATVPADGRPYFVDVYLYAPAAQARYTAVGLFPDEQLDFWGVDQALIFKGVMEHIQDQEFGYADLGVGTRTPLTGIKRDREWSFRDLTPADTALDGLMGISRGIEWDTVTTATTTTATTFYPRQGKTVEYVLVQGGNVTGAVPANTRDVGSAVIAQAQGLGSYRAVAYASDLKAFGGTMIQRVITAEQDTPLNELGETAKAELFWARSSTPSYWVDIDPDSIAEVLSETAKGDTVCLILDYPTPVDQLARIVRRQIHPDSLRLMLAFEEV